MTDPLLRLDDVMDEIGLKKTSIYRLIGEGEFPRPIRIGKRAVAWRTSDLEKWKSQRPEAAF